ncbi:MAG: hypothetical protein HWE23_17335 [Rhodobacteraceae bacterium]|nr:hypothetical protein [Paracoccaceae bacterium]
MTVDGRHEACGDGLFELRVLVADRIGIIITELTFHDLGQEAFRSEIAHFRQGLTIGLGAIPKLALGAGQACVQYAVGLVPVVIEFADVLARGPLHIGRINFRDLQRDLSKETLRRYQ